jgi:transcription termination factor NusB
MPTTVAVPTIDELKELVKTNPRARERALMVLFARQTATEQDAEMTTERNGVGFTSYDADLLSSFAKQVIENRGNRPHGQRLSARQHEVAAKRLPKYARQLLAEARKKAEQSEARFAPFTDEASDRAIAALDREDARRAMEHSVAQETTLFSGCPECHGDLTIDTNVGGELVEMPCPRCVGARV